MGDLFAAVLLGHLVGDYLFQNDWMARNKIRNDWTGWGACLTHCVIYANIVAWFVALMVTGAGVPLYVLAIIAFLTHFPIDKWSLGKKWMKIFGQTMDMKASPFVPLVYVAVDNTMHILLMMLAYGYLLR